MESKYDWKTYPCNVSGERLYLSGGHASTAVWICTGEDGESVGLNAAAARSAAADLVRFAEEAERREQGGEK